MGREALSYDDKLMIISILYKPYYAVCFGFTKDVLAMGLNRSFTDKQLLGNLLIAVFLFNEADDFQLPVGKVGWLGRYFS